MIVIPQLKSNDISDSRLIPEIKRMHGKLINIPSEHLIENSGVIEKNEINVEFDF